MHVLLSWLPDVETERLGPLPHPTRELAEEVAWLIQNGASEWADGGRLKLGPEELKGTPLGGVLHGITARQTGFVGDDGRGSRWGRSLSYFPATAKVTDLTHEIGGKDRVYEACREKCKEAWLVATLTGGPSSFEDVDDAVLRYPFRSAFDQVVLLCPNSRRGPRTVALSLAG